jgi:hypothetical protein
VQPKIFSDFSLWKETLLALPPQQFIVHRAFEQQGLACSEQDSLDAREMVSCQSTYPTKEHMDHYPK